MLGHFYFQVIALLLFCFHHSSGTSKHEDCCLRSYPSYYVSLEDSQMSYFGAHLFCRSKGLELVSIESQEEQDFLNEHLASLGAMDKEYWTSGSQLAKDQKFNWFGTGKPIFYTNWDNGSPVSGNKCVTMLTNADSKLVWTTKDCYDEKFFVCEGYNSFL